VPPYILSFYFIQSTLFYLTPEVLLLNTFLFHYPRLRLRLRLRLGLRLRLRLIVLSLSLT